MSNNADSPPPPKEVVELLVPAITETLENKPDILQPSRIEEIAQASAVAVSETLTQVEITRHIGPLPSPKTMREYDAIVPGAAQQFFQQLGEEQSHRHRWEDRALQASASERGRRDYPAAAIAGGCLIVAGLLAILGHEWPATVLAGVTICAGGALVLGRHLLMEHEESSVEVGDDGGLPNTPAPSQQKPTAPKRATQKKRKGRSGKRR